MQTYKYISQKRISDAAVRFQRNSCSKILMKQVCVKQYDRVWLFDHNLLSEHSSLSHIIKASDFQANILKQLIIITVKCRNIIYKHQVLVRLLTEKGLEYSTFCCQIDQTNFSLFCKISTNFIVEFGSRWFYQVHEFLRT